MKRIMPFWNRVISIILLLLVIFVIYSMETDSQNHGNTTRQEDIGMYIFLLSIAILSMIMFFLHFIEYDEESDYICYSAFGRKFKARLSDVSYVGYLPFGADGMYQIRYGIEKSLPFFCLFGKRKMKELYEAVKKKNSNCEYGF